MKSRDRLLVLCSILSVFAAASIAQNSANPEPVARQGVPVNAAPAQSQSPCGNQPLCTDTPDFTATVTDFRLTNTNGIKVMDVTVRFQNKTADTLILGYEDRSEMAMDDQGNRYAPNPYGNAYRGIGVVAGNNMDPKFSIRPGSWGDASFELIWRPGAQDPIGSNFEYALSVREINTLPGNQHSLGGEFPIHFQGLANGVAGVSPGYSGAAYSGAATAGSPMLANGQALPPCGAAGTVNAVTGAANGTGNQTATNAASQASNAATALSSLGSLFSRKKQANANAVPVAGAPCTPAAASAVVAGAPAATTPVASSAATPNKTGVATPATAGAPTAAVVKTSARAGTPAATNVKAPASATAKPPASGVPAQAAAPAKPATTAAAAPPPAAKPAAKPAAVVAAKKPAATDPKKPANK